MYAGIDQSLTGTGLVVLSREGDELHRGVIRTKLRGAERLREIRQSISGVLMEHGVRCAMLEGYSYESEHRGMDLGELGGVIKVMLLDLGLRFRAPSPTQVKKFVTGTGAATKELVQQKVKLRWGIVARDDNEADAYGLAQIARAYDLGTSTIRSELEVLAALDTPERAPVRAAGSKKRNSI